DRAGKSGPRRRAALRLAPEASPPQADRMMGRQPMIKRNFGFLAVVGGLLLVSACATQPEERGVPEGTPAYQYQAPAQETSPLIYDPGDLGGAPPIGVDEETYDAAAEQCHNY